MLHKWNWKYAMELNILFLLKKQFLKYFLKIVIMYNHIVMIEIIFFTLHVRHGLKIVRNFII